MNSHCGKPHQQRREKLTRRHENERTNEETDSGSIELTSQSFRLTSACRRLTRRSLCAYTIVAVVSRVPCGALDRL